MDFVIEARRFDDPDVQQLIAEVQQEYVRRYGGPDAARVDDGEFDPPRGLFLIGLLGGQPVAIGGWRRLGDELSEIKRMYVAAAARRRGLGGRMLAELERCAAADGVTQVVLNTGPQQPEAIAMYESSGYEPVGAFGHYADTPGAVFFGKRVG